MHSKELQIRSEELRKTTEIMDAISQNSSELIFAKDCQCRLVYANDSLLRFFGKSADEIVGKTDVEFHSDPLIGEAVMENDRIVRETRQSLVTEVLVRSQAGSFQIYRATKSPWLAKGGTLLGTMGFSVDTTEHKHAQLLLKTDLDALTSMHELSRKILGKSGIQPLLDEIMYSAVAIVSAKFGILQLLEDRFTASCLTLWSSAAFFNFFESAENVASLC